LKRICWFAGTLCLALVLLAVPAAAIDAGWQPVVASEATMQGGFNNPFNAAISTMTVYKGFLYAGTENRDGAEIWRSADGLTWTPCIGPAPALIPAGFALGSTAYSIGSLIVFNNGTEDRLYCGLSAATGCQVWSTNDGANWTLEVGSGVPPALSSAGFGNPGQNLDITYMADFAGQLWASTLNPITGAQVFYSPNGSAWNLSLNDGFNDDRNVAVRSTKMFNGAIYVGLDNLFGTCAIVTSTDGLSWDYSVGSSPIPGGGSSITPNGFYAGSNNRAVGGLEVFKGQLYAGTWTGVVGVTELWRTSDAVHWTAADTDAYGADNAGYTYELLNDGTDTYLLAATGYLNAGVFGSTNGTTWTQLNLPGFSAANNNVAVRQLIWFNGYLYAATENGASEPASVGLDPLSAQAIDGHGAEIWRIGDSPLRTGLGIGTPLPTVPTLPFTGN
jgi:hypothetical protein